MAASKKKPDTTTKTGRREFVGSDKWLPFIRRKYGWLVDIYESNPEVAEIIRRGYVQDQPVGDITNLILNSAWANGLQAGEYEYIRGTSTKNETYLGRIADRESAVLQMAKDSGFELDDPTVKQIAADSLKGAWGEEKISQTISSAVVGKQRAEATPISGTPAPATPTGLQMGKDAASIKTTARKYGLSLTPQQVEGYVQGLMTGQLSVQQTLDQFRNQAKSLYPSVAAQLDAGDLESSVSSYTQIAASVLGTDPSRIDYSNPKFARLLTYQDPKTNESRLMNSTEWNQYLRTLPEWKNTSEASSKYDNLIKTVETIFGKVR